MSPAGSPEPLILRDGRVHRLAGEPSPAPAIAVLDGAVAATGSLDQVRAVTPGARELDLEGRTVLPAFIDSHTHFHRAAVLRELYLDFETLRPTSIADVLGYLRARAAITPPGGWIEGDSLTPARLAERRWPTRHELDAAAPDHRVILRGIGKHVIAASSAALAAAGIDQDTPDPPGGRIERDATGCPTGILHERAKGLLDPSVEGTVVPRVEREARLGALRRGMRELHRMGITTVCEMVRTTEEADDLAALHQQGELWIRVRIHYRIHEGPIRLEQLATLGIRRGLGDDWLRVLGVKLSVDGWCIFRNAAVYQPYRTGPDDTGLLRLEPAETARLVASANEQGLGVAVHAVGARAVDAALDAFAAAGPSQAGPYRIEHGYLDVDASRLCRMRDLDVVLSAQPAFLPAYLADWREGLDEERIDRIMPLGSARALGIRVILNSDQPSGPAGPLAAISAAVHRDAGSRIVGATERLDLTDAWRAHTSVPAEVMGDEHIGTLEPGKRADLVILDGDPFAGGDPAMAGVVATMIDGHMVHDDTGRYT
jgi:predicted amidohydrolase YtcJ